MASRRKEDSSDVRLSKALSWLLRHASAEQGISMTSSGYVAVSDILSHSRFKGYTEHDIKRVVQANDKQRFALTTDAVTSKLLIRANQGHTMKVNDLQLKEMLVSELATVIHGTHRHSLDSILKNGLSRMKRQHIHMTDKLAELDKVLRKSCDVLIYINAASAVEDGLKFYRSANDVILCSGNEQGFILPKYFQQVVNRHSGEPNS